MRWTSLPPDLISWNTTVWYIEASSLFVVSAWFGVRYRAFWKDFYYFAITYTGLFAILVLLYLIVYGQVGASFGIQNLFWDSGPGGRLASSCGATLLLGLIGTLACHLDPNPRRSAVKISAFLETRRATFFPWRWASSPQTSSPAVQPAPDHSTNARPDEPGPPELSVQDPGSLAHRAWQRVKVLLIAAKKYAGAGPGTPHMRRLEPFLRAARMPFLWLLAAPALFPQLFPYLPYPPPLNEVYPKAFGASGFAGGQPSAFIVFLLGAGGRFYGAVEWVLGIVIAVGIFKSLIWLSRWTRGWITVPVGNVEIPRWVRIPFGCASALVPLIAASYDRVEWAQASLSSAVITVLLLRGLIWRAARAIWPYVIHPFVHFTTVYLHLNDFRAWPRFERKAVDECNPAAGEPCPLTGCPADDAHELNRFKGCVEKRDRRASILNLTLWFFTVYAAFKFWLYPICSPSVAICLFLGIAAMATASVAYFQPTKKYLFLAGFVGYLILLNTDVYRDRFESMDLYYPKKGSTQPSQLVPLRPKVESLYYAARRDGVEPGLSPSVPPAGLVNNQNSLETWQQEATKIWTEDPRFNCKRPKLVVVSVSGGAARSAYWSAVVLDRLGATLGKTFDSSMRIITGTSGGMLGTACYVEQRYRALNKLPVGAEQWVEQVPTDSLMKLAGYIALQDLPRALLPRMFETKRSDNMIKELDRGTILEDQWHFLKGRVFADYRQWEESGKIPSLILSPMIIEDGRLLLISNLDLNLVARPQHTFRQATLPLWPGAWLSTALLRTEFEPRSLAFTQGSTINEREPGGTVRAYSLSGIEFFKVFPLAAGFRVATAVRMNATFPIISPAVSLPTDPPRHVVDAGYYDNYGIQVAASWLTANREWLRANTSGVLLVQIRDGLSTIDRFEVDDHSVSPWEIVGRGFDLLSTPLQGAAKAASTTAMFRNDLEVEHLSDWFTLATGHRDFFSTVVFENPAAVASRAIRHDPASLPGDDIISALGGKKDVLRLMAAQARRSTNDRADQQPARTDARRRRKYQHELVFNYLQPPLNANHLSRPDSPRCSQYPSRPCHADRTMSDSRIPCTFLARRTSRIRSARACPDPEL